MTDYRPDTPRARLAAGALLMALATAGVLVAAPALLDSRGDVPTRRAAALAASPAPTEVSIVPARVEVIGVREPNVAWALPDGSAPCRPVGANGAG